MKFFFLFCYVFLFVNCELEKTQSTIRFFRQRREAPKRSSLLHISDQIIKDSELFFCFTSKECQKVDEFSIAENYTYNCYELFLPINFYPKIELEKKIAVFGFIKNDGSVLTESQKYTDSCRKIRR